MGNIIVVNNSIRWSYWCNINMSKSNFQPKQEMLEKVRERVSKRPNFYFIKKKLIPKFLTNDFVVLYHFPHQI